MQVTWLETIKCWNTIIVQIIGSSLYIKTFALLLKKKYNTLFDVHIYL